MSLCTVTPYCILCNCIGANLELSPTPFHLFCFSFHVIRYSKLFFTYYSKSNLLVLQPAHIDIQIGHRCRRLSAGSEGSSCESFSCAVVLRNKNCTTYAIWMAQLFIQ